MTALMYRLKAMMKSMPALPRPDGESTWQFNEFLSQQQTDFFFFFFFALY